MDEILKVVLSKKVLGPIITIIVMFVIYKILKRVIKRIFNIKTNKIKHKKQKTLMNFFLNVAMFVCFVIGIVIILGIYGVETNAIVTSLGAVTVVVGLAFQNILKDFIAGISFIFEDSYNVGDWVTINNFKGEVINVGLRTTRIRAYSGEEFIINNGSISSVINYTIDRAMAIVDFNIAYDSDIDLVENVLDNLCKKLKKEIKSLKGDITSLGVEKLNDSSLTFRLVAEVEAGTQYEVQRQMRKAIKIELDKNNIKRP